MLQRQNILIGLTPTAMRVGVVNGSRLSRLDRIPLDPGLWAEHWEKGLRPLDAPLRGLLGAMDVRGGASCRVVYAAPETFVDVGAVPLRGAAALQAATLALRETIRDPSRWLTLTESLHEERADGRVRSQMLLAAETHDTAESISGWVSRAGLDIVGILPSRAVLIRAALDAGAELPTTGAQGLVWLDEHATVLAAWVGGRLEFVRCVDLGFAQLAEAFIRASAESAAVMDREAARRLLASVGIPHRGQTVELGSTLHADAVLPLMQSVLQRLLVEIKQTLRFGIPEQEAPRASVWVNGPGAGIPGLFEFLSGQMDWPLARLHGEGEPRDDASCLHTEGDLEAAVRLGGRRCMLVPHNEHVRRMDRRLRGLTYAGAAASLGLVALLYVESDHARARVESQIAALEPRAQAIRHVRELRERARALSVELGGATHAAEQTLAAAPGWLAVLGELSRLSGGSVELAELNTSPGKDTPGMLLLLRGTAWPQAGRSGDDAVSSFLDRLSRSPMVESARIVSTRSEIVGGTEVRQFQIAAQVRTTPTLPPAPMVAAIAEDAP
ncbi:MAG: hypothetical protein SFY69_13305 [Planctomycetota bacterium]|nr:hypothetical protein [Planctomycetota bacterium]